MPKWIWVAYYAIAVWWTIDGVWSLVNGIIELQAANNPANATGPLGTNEHSAFAAYVMFVAAGISFLGGIGLLIKNEFIRNLVSWVAGLRILFGVLGLAQTVMMLGILGAFGLLILLFEVLGILTSALLIYIIGETDKGAYV